jgi:small subunit ribosomal protein S8
MSMTDPIADMLTRIRNASGQKHRRVDMPSSKLKVQIARLLKDSNFIKDYKTVDDAAGRPQLRLYLRYAGADQSVIRGLRRVSTPGLRKYVGVTEIPRVRNGLGIAILSTSSGLMTDREARRARVGGELLALVW